jgi:DNA polymerase-4
MERQILHVDVNNAFLSWSAVDMIKNGSDIDIREIPSVIGGDESRRAGIVLAKSMKAKVCGISTGETLYQARLKCKDLKVYPPLNYSKYKEYSNLLYELLLNYTDKIERYSIDECFLDMTGYLMNDTLLNKAIEINKRAKSELGFTVNIGVANNKLLAKMASDFTKPDRVHTLYKNEIPTKMWNLPVKELFMLGRKTVPKLYNMGIKTIGDLAKTDSDKLIKMFGKHGKQMWEYANGIDNSEVAYIDELPKCVGNSVTLPSDINNEEKLEEVLLALAEQVTKRLRKYNLLARTVNIQLRTNNFEEYSHQGKLNFATDSTKEVYTKSKMLFEEMYKKRRANTINRIKVR